MPRKFILVFLFYVVGGCSGGGDDLQNDGSGGSGQKVSHIAFINLEEKHSGLTEYIFAEFTYIEGGVSPAALRQRSRNYCSVARVDDTVEPSSREYLIEPPSLDNSEFLPAQSAIFNGVAAGEVLTLASPSGTYGSLTKRIQDEPSSYSGAVTKPVPQGLTLSIPGATFPAMSNVSLPFTPPLVMISPVGDSRITPDTVFQWEPGEEPSAVLGVGASWSYDSGARWLSVQCYFADSGRAEFPADVKAAMGASFVSDNLPTFYRDAVKETIEGDIYLNVNHSVRSD